MSRTNIRGRDTFEFVKDELGPSEVSRRKLLKTRILALPMRPEDGQRSRGTPGGGAGEACLHSPDRNSNKVFSGKFPVKPNNCGFSDHPL